MTKYCHDFLGLAASQRAQFDEQLTVVAKIAVKRTTYHILTILVKSRISLPEHVFRSIDLATGVEKRLTGDNRLGGLDHYCCHTRTLTDARGDFLRCRARIETTRP